MKSLHEIIRELDAITNESVLLESSDYMSMFKPVEAFMKTKLEPHVKNGDDLVDTGFDEDVKNLKRKFEQFVDMARKSLKKNDRIVWYLKYVRYTMLGDLLKNFKKEDMPWEEISKYLTKERATLDIKNLYTLQSLTRLVTMLEHSFSLPIPEIQNTVFTNQDPGDITGHFHDLEKDWKDKQVQITKQEEHHEVILTFPDGKCWFNLNQEYCDKEGKAMGHCGNKAAYSEGDTILSLREPIKGKPGEWRPLLTFILHEDGNLGEMKGRGNTKPAHQYHNHIIELLKLPIIKGISGGGYAPDRNFTMKDLPDNEPEEIYKVKPALAPLQYQYNKQGMNAFLWERALTKMTDLMDWVERSGYPVTYDKKDNLIVLREFKNLKEFLEYCNAESNQRGRENNLIWQVLQYYNGEKDNYFDAEINFDEIKDFIKNLPEEYEIALKNYVEKKYKTEAEDASDIAQTLEENSDETFDLIRSSLLDGYRSGYESEMYEAFRKTLIDWSFAGISLLFEYHNEYPQFDQKVKLIMDPDNFFEMLDKGGDEQLNYDERWVTSAEGPRLEEPRYGWSGYDNDVAMERFKSELSEEVEKFIPKKKKKKN